jgi:hypothetical protein
MIATPDESKKLEPQRKRVSEKSHSAVSILGEIPGKSGKYLRFSEAFSRHVIRRRRIPVEKPEKSIREIKESILLLLAGCGFLRCFEDELICTVFGEIVPPGGIGG